MIPPATWGSEVLRQAIGWKYLLQTTLYFLLARQDLVLSMRVVVAQIPHIYLWAT